MASLLLKVNDKIPKELDLIPEEEGLGNRTATMTFLIKYYFLTKKSSLDQSIQLILMHILFSAHFKKQLKRLKKKYPHIKKDLLVPLCVYPKSETESITENELRYYFDKTIRRF